MSQYKRIGELLLARGLITKRQLDAALKLQSKTSLRFGEVLTSSGAVSEEQIAECLALQYDYPLVNPEELAPEPEALALFDRGFALSHQVLPLRVVGDVLECAIADPIDIATTDAIVRQSHLDVRLMIAPPSRLFAAIDRAYGKTTDGPGKTKEIASAPLESKRRRLQPLVQRDRDALLMELDSHTPSARRRKVWMTSERQ